ncbi:J domain-containing protein [Haloplanus sp. C73]|uniref:J domain-containing protein n=1 Tax=Haloplanus sp. C73 TaxID=3421641 RepID=UPI003EBA340D
MDRDRLVLGLAAVFAGLTVVLVAAAFVYQPFLLFLALPFAATTYLMWQHATGRIEARARRQARTRGPRRESRRRTAGDGLGGSRRRTAPGGTRTRGTGESPSRRDAYDVLGLDADASDEAIRRAYRERVKEVHPDTDGGDEEAFKRVNRAYERLQS